MKEWLIYIYMAVGIFLIILLVLLSILIPINQKWHQKAVEREQKISCIKQMSWEKCKPAFR